MGSESPVRLGFSLLCVVLTVALAAPIARASSFEDVPTDSSALVSLEAKAATAQPRDQCFLYTEILHGWTELAGRAMLAGDDSSATQAIQHADADAAKLKSAISSDSKRLKNAELLLEHSMHRLTDMLRVSSMDEHDKMQTVLRHVSSVHDELLAAVFAH